MSNAIGVVTKPRSALGSAPGAPLEPGVQAAVACVRGIARSIRVHRLYPREEAGAHTEIMRMGQADGMSEFVHDVLEQLQPYAGRMP
jgi:hypothetical protein